MKRIMIIAALAAACISCNKEMNEQPAVEQEITFHAICNADADPASRTTRQEDGKVFWSPNETIGIFQGVSTPDGGYEFTSTNSTEEPTALFKGTLPSGSGNYWGLYPQTTQSWLYKSGSTEYIVTEFTDQQPARAGSFADNLYVAVACSSTTDLSFSHPLGGIKFSVSNSGIKTIFLRSNNGESIATNLFLISYSEGKAEVADIDSGTDMITLTPSSGTFIPGEDYYFVTLPVTLSKGFTMYFQREDGTVLTRKVNTSVNIPRATFRTLMNADQGSWGKDPMTFSPESISVSAAGGGFKITVNYWGDYHVDVAGADWITASGTSGDPRFEGRTHTFTATRNTGAERSAVITVCDESNCYPVIVTQADGSTLKTITHHSLGMRFTADWCGWCPVMNESFKKTKEKLGDKFVIVNFHNGNYLKSPDFSPLASAYLVSSLPTGIVDGRSKIPNYTNTDYGASFVAGCVSETESTYPVTTSLGISSSLSGSSLSVTVKVYASSAADYKLSVFLLEDGIVSRQLNNTTGTTDYSYVHDNVEKLKLTGSAQGDAITIDADDSTKEFNFSATVPSTCNLSNLSVLAYVQKQFGSQPVVQSDNYGEWYIDNCRKVPVGETAEPEVK